MSTTTVTITEWLQWLWYSQLFQPKLFSSVDILCVKIFSSKYEVHTVNCSNCESVSKYQFIRLGYIIWTIHWTSVWLKNLLEKKFILFAPSSITLILLLESSFRFKKNLIIKIILHTIAIIRAEDGLQAGEKSVSVFRLKFRLWKMSNYYREVHLKFKVWRFDPQTAGKWIYSSNGWSSSCNSRSKRICSNKIRRLKIINLHTNSLWICGTCGQCYQW